MRYIGACAASQFRFVLAAGETARQGELATGDPTTGKVSTASVAASQIPIGFFMDEAIGDDAKTVTVRLFEEVWAYRCTNDATTPVLNAFQTVYLQDGGSVSALATGTSIAGIALEVTPASVPPEPEDEVTPGSVLVVFRRLGAA